MENEGNTMGKDFEEFLYERLTGAISGCAILPDILDEIDPVIVKALTEAGVSKETQEKLDLDCVYSLICDHQELVYRQGIKDGFNLALHLLGMKPESRKEGFTAPSAA